MTSRPDARTKAAWAEYLFTEQKLSGAQKEGLSLASQQARLVEMAAAIEQGNYREATAQVEAIGKGMEDQRAIVGGGRLHVLAEELAGRIEAGKHNPVSRARINALRQMGAYAIGENRRNAEFYLNTARGWINLPELPVRQTEITFRVPKAKGITIDGDLKDWPTADWQTADWPTADWQNIPYTKAWCGNPRDGNDISADFAAKWDDDYFYLAVKVKDNLVLNEVSTADNLWEQDSIEVHFNILDDYGLPKEGGGGDGLPQPIYGPDDFQFGFDINGRMANGLSPLRVSLEGSKVGVKKTGDGYQMEVAIPWKIMFVKPVAGYTIGFTMSVNDCDNKGAKYEKQITWRGREVCRNTEGWGRLELVE